MLGGLREKLDDRRGGGGSSRSSSSSSTRMLGRMLVVLLMMLAMVLVVLEAVEAFAIAASPIYAPGECDASFVHPNGTTIVRPWIPHASRLTFPTCAPIEQRPVLDLQNDLGGVPDNRTLNTDAFTLAMTKFAVAGGGTLRIGAGVFLTAPFNLTSCVTLDLYDPKSMIQAITNVSAWPIITIEDELRYSDFITGRGVTDVTIQGPGTIDGGGYMWWPLARGKDLKHRRGNLITFYSSQYLSFVGALHLQNSPCYNVYPIESQHVYAHTLYIDNPADSVNTDGLDPDSTHNVTIADSRFHTGDDAVAIKTHAEPSYDIHARNFTVEAAHCGFCIGSHAWAGVYDVSLVHAHFESVVNGLCFKGSRGTGGVAHDYYAHDVTMNTVQKSAISLNDDYNGAVPNSTVVPTLYNVHFSNVTAQQTNGPAFALIGLDGDGGTFFNVTLEHIQVVAYKQPYDCAFANGTFADVSPSLDGCANMIEQEQEQHSIEAVVA